MAVGRCAVGKCTVGKYSIGKFVIGKFAISLSFVSILHKTAEKVSETEGDMVGVFTQGESGW